MYNGTKIYTGIVIFVLIVTSPFLLNIGKTSQPPQLSTDTEVINQLGQKQCIESVEFMRAEHMQLVNGWRDQVVRDGQTVYVSSTGKKYEMSLEDTCFKCHSNTSQFCDSCHTYAGVQPYCWDCHNESEGAGPAE